MSRLSEELQFVPLFEPEAYGGAGKDTDAIDMSRFSSVTFVFQFGDITGNSTLLFYAGATNALAAAKGTAIAFNDRVSAADINTTLADTFGDETAATAAGITLTAASYDYRTVLVEFDCDQLTTTQRFLVAAVDATANPMDAACIAIGKPRYAAHTGATAL